MVQLSLPYMTTGKTIALIIWTFVGKRMPLLFNTLSNFLEEISSLSHYIVFLYFFALFTLERLSYLSLLFFGALYSDGISFLSSFAFCFSSFLSYF